MRDETETRFSVAAYAVITDAEGHVLLTRRRDGDEWVLPGGSVEESEAPWEAVIREVREETGLQAGAVGRPIASPGGPALCGDEPPPGTR
jgi:8-oxo-dGTP pyrophosphatase MutT (NUDIX family)